MFYKESAKPEIRCMFFCRAAEVTARDPVAILALWQNICYNTRIHTSIDKELRQMCTMMISGSVCKVKPIKIVRDRTLDSLPDFVRKKCATKAGARAFLASVGVRRSASGRLNVVPL